MEDWPEWAKVWVNGFVAVFFLAGAPVVLYVWLTLIGRLPTVYLVRASPGFRLGGPVVLSVGGGLRVGPGSNVHIRAEKMDKRDMGVGFERFRWYFSDGISSTRARVMYGFAEADLDCLTESLAAEGITVRLES